MTYPIYPVKDLRELTRVGHTPVYQLKVDPVRAPFFFVSRLTIDVDGARNAYAPLSLAGASPLDDLANGCARPAHPERGACWGFYKNKDGTVPVQTWKTFTMPPPPGTKTPPGGIPISEA